MSRADSRHLSDLVDAVGGFPGDTELVEILLRRADRLLAMDSGRDCQRVLTDAEIDSLLTGDDPKRGGVSTDDVREKRLSIFEARIGKNHPTADEVRLLEATGAIPKREGAEEQNTDCFELIIKIIKRAIAEGAKRR